MRGLLAIKANVILMQQKNVENYQAITKKSALFLFCVILIYSLYNVIERNHVLSN